MPNGTTKKQLYSKEGDNYFYYLYDNDSWTKITALEALYNSFVKKHGINEISIGKAEYYDNFTYSLKDNYSSFILEDDSSYVATDLTILGAGKASKATIKFNDDKTVDSIEVSNFVIEGKSSSTTYKYSKFNSTHVDLPEVND